MRLQATEYSQLLESLLRGGHCVSTRVRGGSMYPTIPDGAVARFGSVEPQELRLGDIVLTRRLDGGLLCHRLIGIRRKRGLVQTWGDSAPELDPPAAFTAVLGRLTGLQVEGQEREVRRRSRLRMWVRLLKHRLRRALPQEQPEPTGPHEG